MTYDVCCSSFFLISLNCQPALLAMNLQPAACFHSNKLLSIVRVVRPSLAWKETRWERRHVLISPVRRISARPSKGQSELPISRLPPSSIWTRGVAHYYDSLFSSCRHRNDNLSGQLAWLERGVRSDAQLNCTDTRFQKCSQSGKNGSKHPMLSISMAYNVISCKKVQRNTQKLKIADFAM